MTRAHERPIPAAVITGLRAAAAARSVSEARTWLPPRRRWRRLWAAYARLMAGWIAIW